MTTWVKKIKNDENWVWLSKLVEIWNKNMNWIGWKKNENFIAIQKIFALTMKSHETIFFVFDRWWWWYSYTDMSPIWGRFMREFYEVYIQEFFLKKKPCFCWFANEYCCVVDFCFVCCLFVNYVRFIVLWSPRCWILIHI